MTAITFRVETGVSCPDVHTQAGPAPCSCRRDLLKSGPRAAHPPRLGHHPCSPRAASPPAVSLQQAHMGVHMQPVEQESHAPWNSNAGRRCPEWWEAHGQSAGGQQAGAVGKSCRPLQSTRVAQPHSSNIHPRCITQQLCSAPTPRPLCIAPTARKDGYQTEAWSRQKISSKMLPSSSIQGVGKAAALSSQL